MTQSRKGVSAMQLHRQLGISYNAAWRMKHKLTQVMLERDAAKKLSGFVELDDAYLGGERSGGKPGRGAADKIPWPPSKPVVKNVRGASNSLGSKAFAAQRWPHGVNSI